MSFTFTVHGVPKGKGRPRFARMGNFVKTYTDQKTQIAEGDIKLAYLNTKDRPQEPISNQISLSVSFFMPIPASLSAKKQSALNGSYHSKKPDIDNLLKAVLDALNGVAFRDDSLICSVVCFKVYNTVPKTVVTITEV